MRPNAPTAYRQAPVHRASNTVSTAIPGVARNRLGTSGAAPALRVEADRAQQQIWNGANDSQQLPLWEAPSSSPISTLSRVG